MVAVVQANADDGNVGSRDRSEELGIVSLTLPQSPCLRRNTLSTVTSALAEPDSSASMLGYPCTIKPGAGTVSSGRLAQYRAPSAAENRIKESQFDMLQKCVPRV